jgi:hypothetical protein
MTFAASCDIGGFAVMMCLLPSPIMISEVLLVGLGASESVTASVLAANSITPTAVVISVVVSAGSAVVVVGAVGGGADVDPVTMREVIGFEMGCPGL